MKSPPILHIWLLFSSVLVLADPNSGDMSEKDQEPDLEFSEGSPRLGFVQLNSGSTSFNTTLNLTGPILLGLGIATATLFYAYFNAFSSGSSGVGYGSYERARRSPNEVDQNDMDPLIWLDTIQSRLDQAGLSSPHCHHLAVCTAHMDNDDDNNNLG